MLERSTLAERRPVHDTAALESMLRHANLLCTAWDGALLVGVARGLTDFRFCCYLSDLAVDAAYQRAGIGKTLVDVASSKLVPGCKIILLAAPKAVEYYGKIGFSRHPSAWTRDINGAVAGRT